ncbi:MAG: cysteine desulfurase [Bacteroidetes bacterium]|nr:cysteine desulfurase [Rhodothermia bacterium]MCS7154945.1 cysteine desulfurase [Bacteroidota bacterium]MCX7907229.1 cysteine desulfurase [Bacteroidota bacterium]MDW8138045.1 cysteine desulfurase family protein [Bacteroidota bacterium]MDW8286103.1 cysteine desulfurase family protein [Bacteroidota bacterium]
MANADCLVYLDYNATTPVDSRVWEAMRPYFCEHFGNPASRLHRLGRVAAEAIERARAQVAELINADPAEICFTAGATEAVNWAIKGLAWAHPERRHCVTIATEHKAVLEACRWLERQGWSLTVLGVDRQGHVDLQALEAALRPETLFVAVMWANNETGLIYPIADVVRIAHARGLYVLTDATQAVGKIPVDVRRTGVDLLAASGHKFYAPKGAGFLYVRRGIRIEPLLHGGGHEGGLRSGTPNTPAIVGLGYAAQIARLQMEAEAMRLCALRDQLEEALLALGAQRNGAREPRLAHVLNVRFPGIRNDQLARALPELAFSTGSACSSGLSLPSHVLRAMGLSGKEATESIRISLGRFTTPEEIAFAQARFAAVVPELAAAASV